MLVNRKMVGVPPIRLVSPNLHWDVQGHQDHRSWVQGCDVAKIVLGMGRFQVILINQRNCWWGFSVGPRKYNHVLFWGHEGAKGGFKEFPGSSRENFNTHQFLGISEWLVSIWPLRFPEFSLRRTWGAFGGPPLLRKDIGLGRYRRLFRYRSRRSRCGGGNGRIFL